MRIVRKSKSCYRKWAALTEKANTSVLVLSRGLLFLQILKYFNQISFNNYRHNMIEFTKTHASN